MYQTGLRGHSALITGGASGIGQSIAVGLAREGVRLFIADLRPADETLGMIRQAGGQATAMTVDLRDEKEIERMVATAVAELGQLDIFVNVAAKFVAEPVTGVSLDAWSDVMATNLTACVLSSREIARHMISRRRGAILIVGSTVVGSPSYAGAAYRASKTALRSYMETLAIELAPFGIRVNMMTPGPFPTRLVDGLPDDQRSAAAREVPLAQREGHLTEVRGAVLFLLSDELASYVTGSEVFVDGGLHLRPLYIGPPEVVRALNSSRSTESN